MPENVSLVIAGTSNVGCQRWEMRSEQAAHGAPGDVSDRA
jgi:hypothetical protein